MMTYLIWITEQIGNNQQKYYMLKFHSLTLTFDEKFNGSTIHSILIEKNFRTLKLIFQSKPEIDRMKSQKIKLELGKTIETVKVIDIMDETIASVY